MLSRCSLGSERMPRAREAKENGLLNGYLYLFGCPKFYSFPLWICSRSFFYLFISFFLRFRYPQGFSNPCFFFYIRFLTKEKSSYCEKYLSFAWTHPNFSTEISLLFETVYTRKFITFTLFLVRLIIFRFFSFRSSFSLFIRTFPTNRISTIL